MKCKYCQQECIKITPRLLMSGLAENRIGRCSACWVDYYKGFHVLNCKLNYKNYSVSYMDDHPGHWTSVYQHGITNPYSNCISDNIVLSFKFHVKFTPSNFREKLQLYLLFS
jgi:hypothetical protein